jgi:peptidoglycan/LPS O-acetylase OafA/YrhL
MRATNGDNVGVAAGRIVALDSLRAIAMTGVIAQHCGILPCGWIGVWLFFVISGFVVAGTLLQQDERLPPLTRLGDFYARRVARIWPIYIGYALIGLAVSTAHADPATRPAFLSLALFYNNFEMAFGHGQFAHFPVAHLWTISVEFQFYTIMALAFVLLPRRAMIVCLMAWVLLTPILRWSAGAWLEGAGFSPLRAAFAVYAVSPLHFDSFAAGALLAFFQRRLTTRWAARRLLWAGGAALAAYVGAYVLVNFAQGRSGVGLVKGVLSGVLIGDGRQVFVYSAVAAVSAGLVAAAAAGAGGPILNRVLRLPMLQAIGRVSYGGYVYHSICIFWVVRLLRLVTAPQSWMASKLVFGPVVFVASLAATLALAFASFRHIERPISRRVAQWLAGRSGAPRVLAPQ